MKTSTNWFFTIFFTCALFMSGSSLTSVRETVFEVKAEETHNLIADAVF